MAPLQTTRTVRGETTPTEFESRYDELLERRLRLRTRHAERLARLMEEREDLRGVHALADLVDAAVRWTA